VGTTYMRIIYRIEATICISLTSEIKSQVRLVVALKWKLWRCDKTNNILPKGSSYHILDLDEMIMKFVCWKTYKIYNRGEHA
jgi:hypothetical protein